MVRAAHEPGGTLAKKLGNSLRHAREGKNVSQDELAEAIGISQSSIARYERGQMIPRHYVMVLIAAYLLMDVGDVFARPSMNDMWEYRIDEAAAA